MARDSTSPLPTRNWPSVSPRASRFAVADAPLPGGVRLQSLVIPGPAGAIEALHQADPEHAHPIAVLLCHPHPLGGGTMHNKVVHRAASTFVEMGAAVLRFNFRGVGTSEGTHDNGRGELDDARAAWQWMTQRHPDARRWVAGFSFGSWVGAHL